MNVSPISNNQTNFNGYVDKSVIKFIRKSAKAEALELLKSANRANCPVNTEKVNRLYTTAEESISFLKAFMKNCHPKTHLTIEEYWGGKELRCKNSRLSKDIDLYEDPIKEIYKTIFRHGKELNQPPIRTDYFLGKFMNFLKDDYGSARKLDERLLTENYKDVMDSSFLSGIWALWAKCKAKKVDKFAKEINIQTACLEDATNARKTILASYNAEIKAKKENSKKNLEDFNNIWKK